MSVFKETPAQKRVRIELLEADEELPTVDEREELIVQAHADIQLYIAQSHWPLTAAEILGILTSISADYIKQMLSQERAAREGAYNDE